MSVFVAAKFKLHYGDMTDSSCLVKIIAEVRPTEIYNLAAQSHVKVCDSLTCLFILFRFVYFLHRMLKIEKKLNYRSSLWANFKNEPNAAASVVASTLTCHRC